MVVIELLEERPKRFSELKREVGEITQRLLTSVLRGLGSDVASRLLEAVVPR